VVGLGSQAGSREPVDHAPGQRPGAAREGLFVHRVFGRLAGFSQPLDQPARCFNRFFDRRDRQAVLGIDQARQKPGRQGRKVERLGAVLAQQYAQHQHLKSSLFERDRQGPGFAPGQVIVYRARQGDAGGAQPAVGQPGDQAVIVIRAPICGSQRVG